MHKPFTTRARWAILAGALLLAGAITGCDVAASGPMQPATTSSISAVGFFTGSPDAFCIDDGDWQYTAVSLTGSDGETGPIVHTHNGQTSLPTGDQCKSFDTAVFLRFGTWRVTWAGRSCLVTIPQQMLLTMRSNGSCEH